MHSEETRIKSTRVGDNVDYAAESELLCSKVINREFLEDAAQEERGKRDDIKVFGNGLGPRAVMLGGRHTLIFHHHIYHPPLYSHSSSDL